MRWLAATLLLLLALLAGGVWLAQGWLDEAVARALLTRLVSRETGLEVTVRGAIEFELFPRPLLSFAEVRLSSAGDEAPTRAVIDRIDADLDPTALFTGSLEITRLRLVRPEFTVSWPGEEGLVRLLRGMAAPEPRPLLDRVEIIDGSFLLRSGEAALRAGRVDVLYERRPRGGARLEARGRVADANLHLVGELGAYRSGGAAPLRLDVEWDPGRLGVRLYYEGRIGPGEQPLELAGTVRLEARRPLRALAASGLAPDTEEASKAPAEPLALEAALTRDAKGFALNSLRLAWGGLDARGRLLWRGIEPADFTLELAAAETELNADLLARDLPRIVALLSKLAGTRGRAFLSFEGLAWHGGKIRDLELVAAFEGSDRIRIERLAGRLPGSAEFTFRGTARLERSKPQLTGRLGVLAGEPPLLFAWLARDSGMPSLPPARTFALDAELASAPGLLRLSSLDVRLDATRFSGTFRQQWGARPRWMVEGKLERVELDPYLPLLRALLRPESRAFMARTSGALRLELRSIAAGPLRVRQGTLEARLEEGRFQIEKLGISDLSGLDAEVSGAGELAPLRYAFEFAGSLATPARFARLAGLSGLDVLAGIEGVKLRGEIAGDGESTKGNLLLSWPSGRLSGRLALEVPSSRFSLAGVLRADTFERLLRDFGVAVTPEDSLSGPLDVAFEVSGEGDAVTLTSHGVLPGLRYTLEGNLPRGGEPAELRIALPEPPSPAALDAGYRLLATPLALVQSSPFTWPGAWPFDALDWSWLRHCALRLDLSIGRRRALEAACADGRLEARVYGLPLGAGTLRGRLGLEPVERAVGFDAALTIEGMDLRRLAADRGTRLPFFGTLALDAEVRSLGISLRDLVQHLQGEIVFRLGSGEIRGVAFDPRLGPRPSLLGRLPFTIATGELSITRGIVRSRSPVVFVGGMNEFAVEGSFDLYAWILDLRLWGSGAGTSRLHLFGPPSAPTLRSESAVRQGSAARP